MAGCSSSRWRRWTGRSPKRAEPARGARGAATIGAVRSRARGICALALAIATLAPATLARASAGDGVHPGAIVNSSIGQCTDNFLFDGSDGNRYIGSAGHCVLAAPDVGGANAGEKTWAPGTGPVATDSNGARIGEWAYAILQDPKDFSLIRLDPSVAATPQMPTYGGPTGIFTDISPNTVLLQYYGEGIGVSSIAPARSAVAFGTPDPDHVYAQGLVVPGDSGSAIETADGRAVGVIVTTGLHTGSIGSSGIDAGLMGITRLPPQLARAAQMLGLTLTMRTAPLLNGSSSNVIAPTTGTARPGSVQRPPGSSASGGSTSGGHAKQKAKRRRKHRRPAHRKAKHKAKRKHRSARAKTHR